MYNTLYTRRQSGGRFSIVDREQFPLGKVWFVGSTTAAPLAVDSTGHGLDPVTPFATLVYAETQASTDDTIFVLPNHTETLSAETAACLTLDVAGLRIIGLGGRTQKPIFLIDGYTDTYVSITGADTVLENLVFSAGHSDIAKAIIVAADGVEIRGCEFIQNDADENFLECIDDGDVNTCDLLVVEDCFFCQYDTSGTSAVLFDAVQDRCIVRNNVFMGDWTKCIDGTGKPTYITVTGNLITNAATDDNASIYIHANATGIVAYNLGGNENAAKNVNVTATGCSKIQNIFGIPSEDKNGILDPIAT